MQGTQLNSLYHEYQESQETVSFPFLFIFRLSIFPLYLLFIVTFFPSFSFLFSPSLTEQRNLRKAVRKKKSSQTNPKRQTGSGQKPRTRFGNKGRGKTKKPKRTFFSFFYRLFVLKIIVKHLDKLRDDLQDVMKDLVWIPVQEKERDFLETEAKRDKFEGAGGKLSEFLDNFRKVKAESQAAYDVKVF